MTAKKSASANASCAGIRATPCYCNGAIPQLQIANQLQDVTSMFPLFFCYILQPPSVYVSLRTRAPQRQVFANIWKCFGLALSIGHGSKNIKVEEDNLNDVDARTADGFGEKKD